MTKLFLNLTCGLLLSGSTLSADTFIQAGAKSSWRYWDSAIAPAAAWREAKFDEANWRAGSAPLGCDERGVQTRLSAATDRQARPSTAYFRNTFQVADTNAPHGLVLLVRADDGVVAYLNGTEVARFNLPDGEVQHSTRARSALESMDEQEYHRFLIPTHLLRPGRNVLSASVHQWSAPGDDVFFDLALRAPTESLRIGEALVTPEAREVTELYRRGHRIEPDVRIPDGYIDGGRSMNLDPEGHASSAREILRVSRPEDPILRGHLAFARSAEVRALPELARATRIARHVASELSLPGGSEATLAASMLLTAEYANSPLLFGKMAEECPAGVCRHRALLFKLMADEAGLKAALVRGNMKTSSAAGGHAWNELQLDNGQRLLVDIMNPQPDFRFPALTEPVARYYFSVSNVPLYAASDTVQADAGIRTIANRNLRPTAAETPAAATVGEEKLLGSWTVVATPGGQSLDYDFRFEKVKGQLAGSVISPRSGETKARMISFQKGQLLMEVDRVIQGRSVTQVYRGKFVGDLLSCSLSAKGSESRGALSFQLRKEQ